MSSRPVMLPPPPGLVEAFRAYEKALMGNDLAELDRLFAPGPTTLRGDAEGLLVGHAMVSAFSGGRGGAPARRIVQTHVQTIDDDHALVVAVTELERGGQGQQTQLWQRLADGWAITAAHVSAPAPALDSRIWRVVGDPLVPALGTGPLDGETLAVKDVYAVAGHRVGAGNPAWLAEAPVETASAPVVDRLLGAGVTVRGIARSDEFAYSLAGTNPHTGLPPNPRAPHRISGGSSSGSASAVSLGQATIGLGTDTGGSIRVPAAYQGLFGIRTTHDGIDRSGMLALSPSFDSVGWLTRSPELLRRVGEVLLPPGPGGGRRLFRVPALDALADPDVAAAVGSVPVDAEMGWPLGAIAGWCSAFQTWQAWEAWQIRGSWVTGRLDTIGADVRARFVYASSITHDQAEAARATVTVARRRIRERIGDDVLVLPSASSVAPLIGVDLGPIRTATMTLTCLAGIAGLPAVSIPLSTAGGLPCGASLVAAPGRDRDLLDLAVELAAP